LANKRLSNNYIIKIQYFSGLLDSEFIQEQVKTPPK
jgi:hypothetical protein